MTTPAETEPPRRAAEPRDDVPLPPAPARPRARRSSGPRRRRLDMGTIVDAALRILDADGLDAVTMRRVAEELGTGGASLYAYLESKEALVAALFDRVLEEIEIPPSRPDRPWPDQVKDALRETRRVLAAHRDVARATLGNIPTGPNALRASEWVLGELRRSALSDQSIGYAMDLLFLYVNSVAFEESIFEGRGMAHADLAAFTEQIHRYFSELPPDRFPNLTAMAGPLTTFDPENDARFEFGLNVLMRGLASLESE
jgi:TetR/AcrR family tetracycline transcriptional repressor